MRPDWSGPSHLDAGRTGTSLVGHDDWKAIKRPSGQKMLFLLLGGYLVFRECLCMHDLVLVENTVAAMPNDCVLSFN